MIQEIPELARFLAALEKHLKPLPRTEQVDVIQEITSNMQAAMQMGETPAAILERMGKPGDIAKAWLEERMITVDRRRSPRELAGILFQAALRPFLWGMLGFITLMLANTWYLYRHWQHIDAVTQLKLLLCSLPAVVAVALPVAMLLVGIMGVPAVARSLSQPMFKQTFPRLATGILLAGLVVSAVGLAFNDSVVIWANRATVDLQRAVLANDNEAIPSYERSPQEMTLAELGDKIRLREATARNTREVDGLKTDYQIKWSLPFASLSCAALGLVLGTLIARRNRHSGLIQAACSVTAIAAWYILYVLGRQFGHSYGRYFGIDWGGTWIGAWLPNITFLIAALLLGLLAKLVTHKQAERV